MLIWGLERKPCGKTFIRTDLVMKITEIASYCTFEVQVAWRVALASENWNCQLIFSYGDTWHTIFIQFWRFWSGDTNGWTHSQLGRKHPANKRRKTGPRIIGHVKIAKGSVFDTWGPNCCRELRWCCVVLIVRAVSPGTWRGGLWIPGKPLTWLLFLFSWLSLLKLFHGSHVWLARGVQIREYLYRFSDEPTGPGRTRSHWPTALRAKKTSYTVTFPNRGKNERIAFQNSVKKICLMLWQEDLPSKAPSRRFAL